MDTRKIKALIKAVEAGSLSASAEELGYTQSGMTHMMNSLEDELGIRLLLRGKNGVRLTAEGESLLGAMLDLLSASEALEAAAAKLREERHETFRVGAHASIARQWLPEIIGQFKAVVPDIDLQLSMQEVQGIYDAVRHGELDCAVVAYRADYMKGLSWTPLKEDELIAVTSHGAYDDAAFSADFFAGQDFLMPSYGFDRDILPFFDGVTADGMPIFKYTNLDDASIVAMVEHGLGVSILSRLVMLGMNGGVSLVPLSPPAFRQLGIITAESRITEKNIRAFIDVTRRHVLGE